MKFRPKYILPLFLLIILSIAVFVLRLLTGLILGETDSLLSLIDFSVCMSFFLLAYHFDSTLLEQIEKYSFKMFMFLAIIVTAEIMVMGILRQLELWRIACLLFTVQIVSFSVYWYRKHCKKKE